MRLIDADSLADALFDKRKNYPQWIADIIGNMPTIDAIVLLKEQEAKTVESIQIRRNFYAELTGYCPSCKRPLKTQFNNKYCGNCGQAVKWK